MSCHMIHAPVSHAQETKAIKYSLNSASAASVSQKSILKMKLPQHLIACALLAFAAAAAASTPGMPRTRVSVRPQFSWDAVKFVYAFGDSYSFVQGTRGTANFRHALNFLCGLCPH